MEIPTYQSRNPGPGSSGLDPANPSIVGGNAIVQGLGNVASAFAALAPYERRQQEADMVAQATAITGSIQKSLEDKQLELKDRQAKDTTDPREVNKDFRFYAEELIGKTLSDPEIQRVPAVHKYVAQQLQTIGHASRESFSKFSEQAWGNWNEARTLINVDEWTKSAASAQANGDFRGLALYQSRIDHALMGAVGTLTMPAKMADEIRQKSHSSIINQGAMAVVASQSQDFVNAELAGNVEKFWTDRGYDSTQFDEKLQNALRERGYSNNTLLATQANARETDSHRKFDELYTITANNWMAKHLDQKSDDGAVIKAQPTKDIISLLGTPRARAELGPKYHTVLTYYESLDHADRQGVPPRKEDVMEVYGKIVTGKLHDDASVLNASIAKGFDRTSVDASLSLLHTVTNKLEAKSHETIARAVSLIHNKFDYPTSQQIDSAQAKTHETDALTEFYMGIEHASRTLSPKALMEYDFVGEAQKLADNKFEQMYRQVVAILPNSKPLMEIEQAKQELKAGKISPHGFESILQQWNNYERLQLILTDKQAKAQANDASRKKTDGR